MNTSFSTAIATERHQRLVQDAAEYRRGHASRRGTTRHARVSAFWKDLTTASR